MSGWDDELRQLAREFVEGGAERLAQMRVALAGLERLPAAPVPLQDLRRQFHRLAGAGGTYGFTALTELGRAGERLCDRTEADGTGVSAAALAECRQLVDDIESAFVAAAASILPVAATRPEPGERAPREGSSILVVDDDGAILDLLAHLLGHEGMSVRTASTCGEARAALDAAMPDGLVVDIDLPDGSGYTVVEDLRARPGGDAPAVVMISLKSGFLDHTEAIHAGADAYFEKPLDWEGLARKLHQLLDRSATDVRRVLVVEDDPDDAAAEQAVLAAAGYLVRVCDAPLRFSETLAAFRPDLIVMDVGLPDVSGDDLARYVRQDDQYVTTPIVFVTADGRLDTRVRAMKAGADDFLVKPVPPSLLVASVAARLERARFLGTLLNRDGLTRLLRHTSFMEQAQAVVAHKVRHQQADPAALVIIDLDHFKTVNDSYGHQAGDRVLVALSKLLRRHLRRSDLVGRYGGEEFGVLLDHLQEDQAVRLMERLLHEFAAIEHRAPDGSVFHVTFSAGVTMFDRATMDLERWIRAADAALYAAKRAGRNRVLTHREWLASLSPGLTA